MTNEEKELVKEIRELKKQISMVVNKINVLHQLSPENAEIDQAFEKIEEAFRGMPKINPDYKSDRQT